MKRAIGREGSSLARIERVEANDIALPRMGKRYHLLGIAILKFGSASAEIAVATDFLALMTAEKIATTMQ
jgi:hypothetical protein